ncbi:MAG: hypothetical protein ACYCYP_02625 [Leptospirales bacterium]
MMVSSRMSLAQNPRTSRILSEAVAAIMKIIGIAVVNAHHAAHHHFERFMRRSVLTERAILPGI